MGQRQFIALVLILYYLCPRIIVTFSIGNLYINVTNIMGQR